MTPGGDSESREPGELDELIDEFGDRSGPDPARDPELELEEDEVILGPAPDEPDESGEK
jgi:hypothetical protein